MVGRGQLPDVRDKIDHMRVMRSRDPVEFGTRLDEDWVELYLFFWSHTSSPCWHCSYSYHCSKQGVSIPRPAPPQ